MAAAALLLGACRPEASPPSSGAAGGGASESAAASPEPIWLGSSLGPLSDHFNRAQGRRRFIAVLSPTCAECRRGGRAVRDELLPLAPPEQWSVAVVWISMRPTDDEESVLEAARELAHPRIAQFHDSERSAGWALARAAFPALRAPAWDVYLFWDETAFWTLADPPAPTAKLAQFRGPAGEPTLASRFDEERRPVPLAPGRELGRLLRAAVLRSEAPPVPAASPSELAPSPRPSRRAW